MSRLKITEMMLAAVLMLLIGFSAWGAVAAEETAQPPLSTGEMTQENILIEEK